jgi:hypothetical protein
VFEAPRQRSSPEAGGYGLLRCSVLVVAGDRLAGPVVGRAGEATPCVAVRVAMPPGYSWAPTLLTG